MFLHVEHIVLLCLCDASAVEPVLSLSDWLDGIQKTVKHSIQQCRDPESQGLTALSSLPCNSVKLMFIFVFVSGLLLLPPCGLIIQFTHVDMLP